MPVADLHAGQLLTHLEANFDAIDRAHDVYLSPGM